jgi:Uma2 family endonuclease
MTTITAPVEHSVILHGVSWETYERLLEEHNESAGTHFIYDQGDLQIMVISARHEFPNRVLEQLVFTLCVEFGMNAFPLGSTTMKHKALQKGLEPDSAYYIARASQVKGLDIDPGIGPPPDLIVEVDVTSPSLPRFPIYAAFGVPEIWRCRDGRVEMFLLEQGQYVETSASRAIHALTAEVAARFLADRERLTLVEWDRKVRDWARQQSR